MIVSYPTYVRSITNSLGISFFGGALATLLVALVAIITQRSPFSYARALEFVALYPRAVPGLVVGPRFPLGDDRVPGRSAGCTTPSRSWCSPSPCATCPRAWAPSRPRCCRFSPELDRAARISGADWWTTSWAILAAPPQARALLGVRGALHLLLQGLCDRGVPVRAGQRGDRHDAALSFWIQGDAGPVAALAMLQVLLTFALRLWRAGPLRSARLWLMW